MGRKSTRVGVREGARACRWPGREEGAGQVCVGSEHHGRLRGSRKQRSLMQIERQTTVVWVGAGHAHPSAVMMVDKHEVQVDAHVGMLI